MRIVLLVEYLGKNFSGSQAQKDARTVQSALEESVNTWFRSEKSIRVTLSSRTDSGVHALGQVAHFDLPASNGQGWLFDEQELCWGLNGILSADISVRRAAQASSEFHARFSAVERQYVYRILNREQRSPLYKDTHYFLRLPLNVQNMEESILCLPGRHDFSAFKSSNSDRLTTVCQVNKAKLLNLGEGELEFTISANHFVYNMVRIIVGTLVEIGLNKRAVDSLEKALNGRERKLAGPTAPAWGLCLASVKYPQPYQDIFTEAV